MNIYLEVFLKKDERKFRRSMKPMVDVKVKTTIYCCPNFDDIHLNTCLNIPKFSCNQTYTPPNGGF